MSKQYTEAKTAFCLQVWTQHNLQDQDYLKEMLRFDKIYLDLDDYFKYKINNPFPLWSVTLFLAKIKK